jgi:hypothetical protein
MSMKAMAAVVAVAAGEKLDVSQVCRDSGISRKTFYKWVARCRAEGLEGLNERSRRPHHCPAQTDVEVEDAVVRLRKELIDAGLDHGATTIQWHLGRRRRPGDPGVPSVATIHRILVRRGQVVPEPRKRPRTSWRRFEAPAPNEWWQIDSTTWVTAAGPAEVFNILDDHSRVACRSRAMAAATGEEAWETFIQAAQRWGLPAGVLSDNGLCFSGKLRGFEVLFEARLRDAGIRPITPRPPARSNGSSRPSRSGCAARTNAAGWPVTSPTCKPAWMSSSTTTTRSDPTKASAGSPRSAAGRPHQLPAPLTTRWPTQHHGCVTTPSPSAPAVSSTSPTCPSVSAPTGPPAPSPSPSTAPTPPSPPAANSSDTSASITAATTNPPADAAAAHANPDAYRHDQDQ